MVSPSYQFPISTFGLAYLSNTSCNLQKLEPHEFSKIVLKEQSLPLNLWIKKLFNELSQDVLPSCLTDLKQLTLDLGEKNAPFLLFRAYEFVDSYYPNHSVKNSLAQQLAKFSNEEMAGLPTDYIFDLAAVSPAFIEQTNGSRSHRLVSLVKVCALGVLGIGVFCLATGRFSLPFHSLIESIPANIPVDQRGVELSKKCAETNGTNIIGKEPKFWACIEKNPENNLLITPTKDYMGPSILDLITGDVTVLYSGKKVYKYEGSYFKGKAEGEGKGIWPSGTVYEGGFINGQMAGQGKYFSSTGDTYEGGFFANQFNGKGKYTWHNGRIFEGNFVDGIAMGRGKHTSPSGIYEGDVVTVGQDDGTVTYRNEGQGKFTWANGDWYEGCFLNSKPTGEGSYFYKDGTVKEGDFIGGGRGS